MVASPARLLDPATGRRPMQRSTKLTVFTGKWNLRSHCARHLRMQAAFASIAAAQVTSGSTSTFSAPILTPCYHPNGYLAAAILQASWSSLTTRYTNATKPAVQGPCPRRRDGRTRDLFSRRTGYRARPIRNCLGWFITPRNISATKRAAVRQARPLDQRALGGRILVQYPHYLR